MNTIRVAVIGGGTGVEHDVSLASAAGVVAALDLSRFEPVPLTIGRDGRWSRDGRPLGDSAALSLARAVETIAQCDVVFPLVHGPHGEDGTLAALADLAGVPVVGSALRAGAIGMDKWTTKLVARAVGVRVAPGRLLTAPVRVAWGGPVVVKPVAAGSSHGVTLVREPSALGAAVDRAFAVDDRVLVEQVVAGREVDIAVLRRGDGTLLLSPPLEIVEPDGGVFGTAQKYDGSAPFVIPAVLADQATTALERHARAVFTALGCAGVARVDFFLTEQGWVLNEVNTVPGMTAQSQVPLMYAAGGLPYGELLGALIDSVAVARRPAA